MRPQNPNPPEANTTEAWAEEDDHFRQSLHILIDLGTDFARILHHQASAAPQAEPAEALNLPIPNLPIPNLPIPNLAALAAAFDRIARTVRRSILLARKLREPPAIAKTPGQARAAARKRIIRDIEDSIDRHARKTETDPAALEAEFHERLDSPELEDDLNDLPIETIISQIRRDLGLETLPGTTPWRRRTPNDLATLAAKARTKAGLGPPAPAGPGQRPGSPPRKSG